MRHVSSKETELGPNGVITLRSYSSIELLRLDRRNSIAPIVKGLDSAIINIQKRSFSANLARGALSAAFAPLIRIGHLTPRLWFIT